MLRRLIFAALVLIPTAPVVADACSCMSSNTRCNQGWKAGEVIFLGTVIAKNPVHTTPPPGVTYIRPSRIEFRFSVTESFRGPATPGKSIVVYTGAGGGDCGYPFSVGTSYLVYAFASKDELTTSICSPTSPEVMARPVVAQLRAMQRGQRVDDLFGMIGTAPKGVGHADLIETTPLADVRVRLIGNRSPERSTTTDGAGIYSFHSLPPDTYRVEVDLPSGMSTW
jgi:hypothetical protein